MVQQAIEKGIGHDAMNTRLRHYMGDRVRLAQSVFWHVFGTKIEGCFQSRSKRFARKTHEQHEHCRLVLC
eukprot:6468413-Amphidinium_carterae.2